VPPPVAVPDDVRAKVAAPIGEVEADDDAGERTAARPRPREAQPQPQPQGQAVIRADLARQAGPTHPRRRRQLRAR
jgi:hypothetical protein